MQLSDEFRARYSIESVLGEGGMGRVLLATDLALDRKVAIKFLSEINDDGPISGRQRFEEEARVCASLKHPNIVTLFSTGFEGARPYLVFEFVAGHDVGKELEACGRLPADRALAIAAATLAGLQVAHEAGVIHRDVKPSNILLRADGGEPMLMDFGVARSDSRSAFMTQSNIILGTPLYMSPELIRREPLGPPADLYALGCTLYELLTGKPPFVGKTDVLVLEMQLRDDPVPIRQVRPELSEDVEALIARALEKAVALRFQTAREMGEWVDAIRGGRAIKRAVTARELPAPVAPRTRPDLVTPRSRPDAPRSKAGVPADGPPSPRSKPDAPRSRAGVPSARTVIGSKPDDAARGTRPITRPDQSVLDDTPSAISSRRSRRAQVFAIALAGLGLGVIGAFVFARSGASEVRLTFGAEGLEIRWRTSSATVGRVHYRVLEDSAPAGPDAPEPRTVVHAGMSELAEPGAGTAHTVLLRGMKPGDRLLVSIDDGRGASAWARALQFQPGRFARQEVASGGGTRIVAPTGRAHRARLVPVTAAGERPPVAPAQPDAPELVFDVEVPPAELGEGTRLEIEQVPGVTVEMPVRTMAGEARRLYEKLDRFAVAQEIRSLTKKRVWDRNLDFPQLLRIATFLDAPADIRTRRAKPGEVRAEVIRLLEKNGILPAVEAFRPYARAFFEAGGVPDEAKLRLYAALLELKHLDSALLNQREPENMRIGELFDALVHFEHRLYSLESPAPAPAPGETTLIPRGFGMTTDDYTEWDNLQLWVDTHPMYGTLVDAHIPGPADIRSAFAPSRQFEATLPPGRAPGAVAILRARLTILGSAYHVDIVLPTRTGGAPLRVRLCQPGSDEWLLAMDGLNPNGKPEPVQSAMSPSGKDPQASALTGKTLRYGEIEVRLPARLLPEGPVSVGIQFRHLPGPTMKEMATVQRAMLLMQLGIRIGT